MQQENMYQKAICTLLCFLVGACATGPPFVVSGSNDYAKGWADGMIKAKGDPAWALAGFGCGFLGIGAAYYWDYQPPASDLVGKSSEYVVAYVESYRQRTRQANTKHAVIGTIVGIVAVIMITYYEAQAISNQ